jgi:hypothetical protein
MFAPTRVRFARRVQLHLKTLKPKDEAVRSALRGFSAMR